MGETIRWIDADNGSHDLTDGVRRFSASRGRTGLWMPTFAFAAHEMPGEAGARLTYTRTSARDVDIPFAVLEEDETALRSLIRSLARALDPTRGDGVLEVTRDGVTRRLTCRYTGGLEQARTLGPSLQAVLSFRAFEPYWEADSAVSETYETGEAAAFFPFFPLTLASSTVLASPSVENDGDVEAFPVWTITGPGSNPSLKNLTTGETLSLTLTLGAGEEVVIDTRRGRKTVLSGTGANLFSALSDDSSLWSLAAGTNRLQIEMDGATEDSAVTLGYTPRYLSA